MENPPDLITLHSDDRHGVIPTPLRLGIGDTFTGRGVTIAILDSGFYPHPDLTEPHNRIAAFVDLDRPDARLNAASVPQSWDWHGTQTAVAAAGSGHLSGGLYRGLASQARLVLVKVSRNGRIAEADIARGLRWVLDNRDALGIRVVSISLGGDDEISYIDSEADRLAEEAVASGLTVVVAAGNSGCTDRPRPVPPANAPSVITVGGYNDGNRLANVAPDLTCSSYGPTVDGLLKPEVLAPAAWVAAPILPGTDDHRRAAALCRLSAAPDYLLPELARGLDPAAGLTDDERQAAPTELRAAVEDRLRRHRIVSPEYQHVDGTSFAAPVVASLAALMLEANPKLTPAGIKEILVSTATRLPGAEILRQGYGLLDAPRALEFAARESHALHDGLLRPPRVEGGRLIVEHHADQASSVALVADFQSWDAGRAPLQRNGDGIWRTTLEPPPAGLYRYKFLLDGRRWVDDPLNGRKEPDGFGGFNSLLGIE